MTGNKCRHTDAGTDLGRLAISLVQKEGSATKLLILIKYLISCNIGRVKMLLSSTLPGPGMDAVSVTDNIGGEDVEG